MRFDRQSTRLRLSLAPRLLRSLRSEWLALIALVLLALPALWPLFTIGVLQGFDVPNHLMRLVAFDQQIRAGNLYPRWMPDLALGYGYPLFNYYAPATYYLAEFFRLAGLAYAPALGAALAVLVIVGGLGMWRLAADFFEPARPGGGWPALVAATAYMYAPYLLDNVYVRGAIAELGAQVLLPWVLWSLRRLLRSERPRQYVLPFAFSLAGLALAHNLTLVMVAPVLLAYAALLWWQRGHPAPPLGWLMLGGLLAVGLCAVYWWPLLGERTALGDHFAEVARIWLPPNMWTWPGFLDAGFAFTYALTSPFVLGLVQVSLAIVGLAAARRLWNAEWLFWALVGLLACVVMGKPFLPIWLNVSWLLIFQFPWRLLVLAGIPLALFAGGGVLAAPAGLWRGTLALLLLGLMIVSQRPRPDGVPRLPADQQALGPAAEAQFETQTDSLGATTDFLGTTSDFMPLWVDQRYGLISPPAPGEQLDPSALDLSVQAAGPTDMEIAITATRPSTLRFTNFYFPGWRLTLDDGPALAPYPSTHLGLLSVDLPAGDHRLSLAWAGTTLERLATVVSLAALAAAALFAWRLARAPWLAAACLAGLLFTGIATALPEQARLAPVSSVAPPFEEDGLLLAGYRDTVQAGRQLELRPYWFVRQTPPDVEMDWRLLNPDGSVAAETRTRPFYDTVPATSWRAGTLADDAYTLTLPGGLPAGRYALELCVSPVGTAGAGCAPRQVGQIDLASPAAPLAEPRIATDFKARFGDDLLLKGYNLRGDGRAQRSPNGMLVFGPGDSLELTLFWQAVRPPAINYHSFVQLLNGRFDNVAQNDKMLGPYFFPPRLWDDFSDQADTHSLTVPASLASGVYWPSVGVYDSDTYLRLNARNDAGADLGSAPRLAPIKVLNPPGQKPQHALTASFEGLGQLLGYDLDLPAEGLRAGGTLTLTVYYAAGAQGSTDFTRFVHLYSAQFGLAAQADSAPQDGVNPTSAWLPGEVVADPVRLTLPATTPGGRYALQVGFYDPASGDRLTVRDASRQTLPDGQAVLTELDVNP